MNKIRIRIVQILIQFMEDFLLNPKLKRFYSEKLPEAPLIIDVGANKGQSIVFFKKLRPKATIIAFEANKNLVEKLFSLSSKFQYLSIIPKGVSNVNGKKIFHVNVMDETSTFEELNFSSRYLNNKSAILGVDKLHLIKKDVEVDVVKLNDFLYESKIKYVDLLKLDTEGHEFKCLQGLFVDSELQNFKINRIQFEFHEDDMYHGSDSINDIFDLLIANKYILEKQFSHPFGKIKEYIFMHNDLRYN